MKKSLSVAYGLSKRSRPGAGVNKGAVKKAISPISDGGRLVDILMDRKKMAQGGEVEQEEEASGEELEDLNEDAVGESTDDDSDAETDKISNEIGDPEEKAKEDESLSARARRKMKSRK